MAARSLRATTIATTRATIQATKQQQQQQQQQQPAPSGEADHVSQIDPTFYAEVERLRRKHQRTLQERKQKALLETCRWARELPRPNAAAAESHGQLRRSDSLLPNQRGPQRRVTCCNSDEVVVRGVATVHVPMQKPLPSSCAWVGLTQNFKVREDDEDEVPRFIPYFGDASSEVGEEAVRLFTNSKLRIKLPTNPVADSVYAVGLLPCCPDRPSWIRSDCCSKFTSQELASKYAMSEIEVAQLAQLLRLPVEYFKDNPALENAQVIVLPALGTDGGIHVCTFNRMRFARHTRTARTLCLRSSRMIRKHPQQ